MINQEKERKKVLIQADEIKQRNTKSYQDRKVKLYHSHQLGPGLHVFLLFICKYFFLFFFFFGLL